MAGVYSGPLVNKTVPSSALICLTPTWYHSMGKNGSLGKQCLFCLLLTLLQQVNKGLNVIFRLIVL